jgi:hypothetical protein
MTDDFRFQKYVDKKQITWDASSLDSFTRCPRYYQYSNLIGYRSKVGAMSPTFGSAVHYAMEIYEIERYKGTSKEDTIRLAVREMVKDFGHDLQASTDTSLTLETAIRAVVWKIEEYWNERIGLMTDPEGKPAVEVRFEVPFEDTGYRLSGRIDKMVHVDATNEIYIGDYKTTKSGLSPFFFDRYSLGNQLFAYTYALRRVMGMKIDGFMIDAIHTMVNSTRFDKAVFKVSEAQIDEWVVNTRNAIQLAEKYHADKFYAQNYNGCNAYGGCQFGEICRLPPERRQTWLDSEFQIKDR